MKDLNVTLFILIFPGILGYIIVRSLTVQHKNNTFFFLLYSFVLGLVNFAFLQLVIWFFEFAAAKTFKIAVSYTSLSAWSVFNGTQIGCVSPSEIIQAITFAIPIALAVSAIINNKVITKLAKRWNVSQKYGDENLFYYYLNSKEVDWVYIRDAERDLVYQGRVLSYSESEKTQEIVLSEVTVYTYYNPTEIYSTPTIYLSREYGNFIIEQIPEEKFTQPETKEAYCGKETIE